jgi:Cof subfamily protein (haloacid dehalogenase superfamily)
LIKLVAIDLDGTLFDSSTNISDKNKQSILKCLESNIKVIITTAKTTYWVKKLITLLNLKDPQIASAGATIIDSILTPIFTKIIPLKYYKKIVELARKHNIGFCSSCLDGFVYYESDNPYLKYVWETGELPKLTNDLLDANITKQVLLVTATVQESHIFNKELLETFNGDLKIRRGGPYFLAASNRMAGKASALKRILKILRINNKDIMAIGDSESDLEMIKLAGIGVAMGNASEVLKSAADFIVKDNDNDGVSEAIEKFCF